MQYPEATNQDNYRGGLWTFHLHQNLKLPLPISVVLDQTYDTVMKEPMSSAAGRIQESNYHCCMVEVYLKGRELCFKQNHEWSIIELL